MTRMTLIFADIEKSVLIRVISVICVLWKSPWI